MPSRRGDRSPKDLRRPRAATRAKNDKPLRNFFECVDPEKLQLFLASKTNKGGESKYTLLASALADPAEAHKSPMLLCRQAGVSFYDLVEGYVDFNVALGHLAMVDDIPRMMRENVQDALPTEDVCPRCDGLKRVPSLDDPAKKRRCPKCNSIGKVRVSGNIEAKRLASQQLGLIDKKVPLVAQQFNLASGGVPTVEQMIDVRDSILAGKVVEGEVEP